MAYPRFKIRPACGTRSGYDYHRRELKEDPCTPCQDAERKYHKDRYYRDFDKIKANRDLRVLAGKYPKRIKFSIEEVTALYGTDCYHCNEPIDFSAPRGTGKPGWERSYHTDHLIPLSRGGEDTLENIRPSHGQCNVRKWATVKND